MELSSHERIMKTDRTVNFRGAFNFLEGSETSIKQVIWHSGQQM